MLESKMKRIMKNKYIAFLIIIISIIFISEIVTMVERENHKSWIYKKEQEFKLLIDDVYSVMKGEKDVLENDPLFRYDISHYANYQNTYKVYAEIKINDIEEILLDRKYKIAVIYTQTLLDENGKTIAGSARVHSDWIVEKGKDGMWEIVEINELA